MTDFEFPAGTRGLALFGPSGSGKSTFIDAVLETFPRDFVRPYIVTTRPPRHGESPEERRFLSADEFLAAKTSGDIVYASEHYGHWHGARRQQLEEMSQTGKILLLDPNQFPRLKMLSRMFQQGKLVVISFVPRPLEEITNMSDDALMNLFAERMNRRGNMASEELQLRLEECLDTMRECCRNHPRHVFVNDFARPFDVQRAEFLNLLRTEFPELPSNSLR